MDTKSAVAFNSKSTTGEIFSWLFGIISIAIGIINTFWGNDPGYGVFVILLAFVFFPPVTVFIKRVSGISIPLLVRIILSVFILWTALGVAELFDKIDLMLKSF